MPSYFIGSILNQENHKPENDKSFDFTAQQSKALGDMCGVPVRLEHDKDMEVGRICRSWATEDGSHYVLGCLNGDNFQSRFGCNAIQKNKDTGHAYYEGLSLQHVHTQYANKKTGQKSTKEAVEVSLTTDPRRPDCKIIFVDSIEEPSPQETNKILYKRIHNANHEMADTQAPATTNNVEAPEQASEPVQDTPTEMSRDDMMKVIIEQQRQLDTNKTDDDTERQELLALKAMMEKEKEEQKKKAVEKSAAMIDTLVGEWSTQVDKTEMTDAQIESIKSLVKNNPEQSMELLRVAHCASKHAKRQEQRHTEYKAVMEKTALSTKFQEVMTRKRSPLTDVPAAVAAPLQPIQQQQVVHAASKRQKLGDAEAFSKAMKKWSVGGSARDHMESVSNIGVRRRPNNNGQNQPRSSFY
jgi:hypothetical protein